MSPSGCSKRLDYEASAGWTTYGTWRATFHCFWASRHDMKAPQKIVGSWLWAVGSKNVLTAHCPLATAHFALSSFQGRRPRSVECLVERCISTRIESAAADWRCS